MEASDLFLPFLCGEDGIDNRREDGLDCVGVDSFDDAQSSFLCSILDRDHLVANGCENRWEENDKIRLDSRGGFGVFSNCLDGIESALSGIRILLVAKLLLESLDGPKAKNVSMTLSNKFFEI